MKEPLEPDGMSVTTQNILCMFISSIAMLINEDASKILKPNVVILFELLDFDPNLLLEDTSNLTKDGFYRIAWAFLRPIGNSKVHLD